MPNVTVQARVSPELKQEAEAVLSDIGLSTADAIRVFLKQVVNSGGLPFQPTARIPSAATREAIIELENEGGSLFQTVDGLFTDWKS
jgi:DNA-damage-inducible protein J